MEVKEGQTTILHLPHKLADEPLELVELDLVKASPLTGKAENSPVLEWLVRANEFGVEH